jgi:transposase
MSLNAPSQLSLGLGVEQQTGEIQTETISYQRNKEVKKPAPHGRNELPAHLPRHDLIIEPDENTAGMTKIGEEITEELDYKPGLLFVNLYSPKCAGRWKRYYNQPAAVPSYRERDRRSGPSCIWRSAILDHLPLYRQRQQFKCQVDLSDSTLGDWIKEIVNWSYAL